MKSELSYEKPSVLFMKKMKAVPKYKSLKFT